ASIPSFKWDIKRLLTYYRIEAEKAALDIRLGVDVSLSVLEAERPDTVILATGSEAVLPEVPGIDGDRVLTAIDALVDWNDLDIGERVMVLGAGLVGYEMAWHAAEQGRQVTMVSRRADEDVANLEEHGTNLALLIKGTRDAGVRVVADRQLKRVDDKTVTLVDGDGAPEIHEMDHLIVSHGYTPRQELARHIEESNLECDVLMAGDCVEVRNFFDAINEAAHLVRTQLNEVQ
ncbi:MAG: FAD-dependent oxidoreductase, partial [Gemmatimonadetes bacterium]|nr:FAD-dependent oxidoreductase [Gemmatimonadota bacterium]